VKEEVNMATQTKEVATQEKAVVQWKGEAITISFRDVKSLICHLATDQETAVFLKTCQSLNLNPFAGEIYLIKYSEKDKAAMVIAIDSYLKAAETNDNYNGHEAGIILKDSAGKLEFREGSFLLGEETDKLVGGWAKVYRKDRDKPFYMAVNKAECLRYTKDGHLTQFWTVEKQPSMLRKTALKRALVEAFPQLFAGAYSTAEFEEIPEGELPPAYEKNGETNWKKWWARQKEKGLSADDVHKILNIQSLKEDWIEKGRTLEEAEDTINDALEKAKAKAEKPEAETPATQPPIKPKVFKTWGELAQAAAKLGVNPSDVFKRAGRKKWEDFIDFRDAWNYVEEIVTERAIKPKML
jgi:phage recombination protein Bet